MELLIITIFFGLKWLSIVPEGWKENIKMYGHFVDGPCVIPVTSVLKSPRAH